MRIPLFIALLIYTPFLVLLCAVPGASAAKRSSRQWYRGRAGESSATSSTIAVSSAESSSVFSSASLPTSGISSLAPTTASGSSSILSTGISSSNSSTGATSTPTTITPQPTTTIDPVTQQAIETIHERRLSSIIGALTGAGNIAAWLSTLGTNGKWPDSEIDYTTGCPAQRANWPAEAHWSRIATMAGAWHGGLAGGEQYVKDESLHASISLAMDFWFANDFTVIGCLDSGGTASCPCGTPGFWNTNWFSNIIGIPELVGESCLILNDTLSTTQVSNCTHITGRAYATFSGPINGVGLLTGSNTLDVAKIGIDGALLVDNVTQVTDAYGRIHAEVVIRETVSADGIRPDGSFGQHGGLEYSGNYGKDYTNDVLDLEIEAGGTQFAATTTSQTAFATLFDGDRWMVYRNVLTGVLHWDFSVEGRFISFPVIDNQATGSLNINLTKVKQLGQEWSNDVLIDFATELSQNTTTANAGDLVGNRIFYTNDYIIHRGSSYVSTLKMFSSRTKNTECTNSENPLGFHLSDGTLYTYQTGDEYEDIAAAWDWNLIPGITTDYGATPLNCAKAQFQGLESFVGGVSDGQIGVGVMRYTNPYTKALHWQKAWFFLPDDVQRVMIANLSSATNASVYSVLDQRRLHGPVVIDGLDMDMETTTSTQLAGVQSLWHANVGYSFPESPAFALTLDIGEKTGNWSAIGISTQPPPTIDLFAAWIQHHILNVPLSYTVFPATTRDEFKSKSQNLQVESVQNDAFVSAVFDHANNIAMVVFWAASGGNVTLVPSADSSAPITIAANGNIALIYDLGKGVVTVSDPSQSLVEVEVDLSLGEGKAPPQWASRTTTSLIFALPESGLAGSSVSQTIVQ